MSDRTFRLIFDGKKGGLVKGSSPSSAAKKASKKLSAETGKTSFKFELQETTKDSKKKVYGPYKIKVKMAGGVYPFTKNTRLPPFVVNNSNDLPNHVNLSKNFSGVNKSDLAKQLSKLIKIQKRIQKLHDEFSKELSNKRLSESPKNTTSLPKLRTNKLNKFVINFANYNLQESLSKGDVEQKFYELSHFYEKINSLIRSINQTLTGEQVIKADNSLINIEKKARNNAKQIIIREKGVNFLTNPRYKELEERVKAKLLTKINRYKKTNNQIYQLTEKGEENNYVNL